MEKLFAFVGLVGEWLPEIPICEVGYFVRFDFVFLIEVQVESPPWRYLKPSMPYFNALLQRPQHILQPRFLPEKSTIPIRYSPFSVLLVVDGFGVALPHDSGF